MAQGPDEVEEIRTRIEQTRVDIGQTIDAIQTRLSPSRVIADAKESVTDATVGRLKRLADRTRGSSDSILQTVRDNPLPLAMLATTAAGLIVGALTKGKRRRAPLIAAATAGAACWAIWIARTPASRFGTADELAQAVANEGEVW